MTEDRESDSEPVPKLPRGRGMRFSGPELFRIAITLGLLIALVVLTKPCSHAVSTFVMGFNGSAGSAGSAAGSNAVGSAELIPLRGMTDDQVKETVERAQHHRRPLPGGASPTGSATGSAGSATGSAR
ncbi:MAG TPA: hypothetical protein VGG74_22855 [Kofleriaceae bacterium]|jgi:hypothetical protein